MYTACTHYNCHYRGDSIEYTQHTFIYIEDRKDMPKLSPFDSWPCALVNPRWHQLPISRTNLHFPIDVRVIEVRLYQRFQYDPNNGNCLSWKMFSWLRTFVWRMLMWKVITVVSLFVHTYLELTLLNWLTELNINVSGNNCCILACPYISLHTYLKLSLLSWLTELNVPRYHLSNSDFYSFFLTKCSLVWALGLSRYERIPLV